MTNLTHSLGGKLFNAVASDKKIFCERCNKFTNHVSVSYSYGDKEPSLGKAIMVVFDYVPLLPVLWGNHYVCEECKRAIGHGGIVNALEKSNETPVKAERQEDKSLRP